MRIGTFVMGTRGSSYPELLEQAVRLEELGFDSIVLAERHFRHAPLLYPAPLVVAGAIAARTERIRIGTAGRILPLDHPIHIAEDAATVDVLSGGRLDFGVTRASLDEEAHSTLGSPLDESHGRFSEALEIIRRAWTSDSFSFEGEHFQVPEISVRPRPVQQPHPPFYVVAVSPARLAFAAREGINAHIGAIRTPAELGETAETYRAGLRAAGHDPASLTLSVNRFIYVADGDDRAREEFEAPFYELMHHRAPDLKGALIAKYGAVEELTFDRMLADFCICGGPETVARRLSEVLEETQTDSLLTTLNFATLDHALCLRSMELFASEVRPMLEGRAVVTDGGR